MKITFEDKDRKIINQWISEDKRLSGVTAQSFIHYLTCEKDADAEMASIRGEFEYWADKTVKNKITHFESFPTLKECVKYLKSRGAHWNQEKERELITQYCYQHKHVLVVLDEFRLLG